PNILFDVSDKGCLNLKDRAVIKTYLPDRKILHGVSLVIPVGPLAGNLRRLVAVISPCVARSRNGTRRTHDVMSHLNHMHADINHRTAALPMLLSEDAPVRNAAPA